MAVDGGSGGGEERRELKVAEVIGMDGRNSGVISKTTSDGPPDSPSTVINRKENREEEEEEDLGSFPPLITTLNENGRPRFKFEKFGDKDGRLTMHLVPSEWRWSVFRSVRSEGRLRMHILHDAADYYDHNDDRDGGQKINEYDHSRSVYAGNGGRHCPPPHDGGQ